MRVVASFRVAASSLAKVGTAVRTVVGLDEILFSLGAIAFSLGLWYLSPPAALMFVGVLLMVFGAGPIVVTRWRRR